MRRQDSVIDRALNQSQSEGGSLESWRHGSFLVPLSDTGVTVQ